MELILGSASPRRKALLSLFDIPFRVVASDFDEESFSLDSDPQNYTQSLAAAKGEKIAEMGFDLPIITADTTVFAGKIINKPKDELEAFEILQHLNQVKKHDVVTSLALTYKKESFFYTETSHISFRPLSDKQIWTYVKTVRPFDYAGAYSIQGVGHLLISEVEGCFTNIIGFPLRGLEELLARIDIDLWDHFSSRSFLTSPSS